MKVFPENINPDLVTAYLLGETDASETILVKEWIDYSAENKAEFDRLQRLWEEAATAFPEAGAIDTDMAWAKVSERISRAGSRKRILFIHKHTWVAHFRTGLKVAAVLIPLFVVATILFVKYNKATTLSATTTADTTNITLPDGSLVQLNRHSTLTYPGKFKGNTREVRLEGEAFFTVTPDTSMPFIIHMPSLDLKVVGTSFNVRAVPGEELVEVSVKSGKVMLYALRASKDKNDSLALTAGNKGVFQPATNSFRELSSLDENALFWISKTLIFNRMPLDSVILTLEKTYDIKIRKKNDSIGKLRLSARFEGTDIDNIMEIIRESLGLRMTKNDSIFILDESKE